MARACEVCNHSKRHEIDLAIIQNKNISQIARDYNVSYYSVYKHKKNHIVITPEIAAETSAIASDLINELEKVLNSAKRIYESAVIQNKGEIALRSLAEIRQTLEVLAKARFSVRQIEELQKQVEVLQEQLREKEAGGSIDFAEKIKILNNAELEVFNKLIQKIKSQAPDIVIPEDKTFIRLNKNKYTDN